MATAADDHLLERDEANAQLDADLERARLGSGRVALVGGEAGVGKTSVARSFAARHEQELRVVWGACEALFTPRPLGPVLDIAQRLEGFDAGAPTTDGQRAGFFAAFLDELRSHPTIAVFEDVHWADEATLDALKYLGRRIDDVPALLVLTFRDDEVGSNHPLRQLLGDLASAVTSRVTLRPLSVEASRSSLAGPRSRHEELRGDGRQPVLRDGSAGRRRRGRADHGSRCRARAGEPTELRRAPPARCRRSGAGSVDVWLLEELASEDFAHLSECLASGTLTPSRTGVGFRHELGRLAIEHELAPDRRISVNEKAFRALAAHSPDDLSALAHHADAAGNSEAVLRFAPAAATRLRGRCAPRGGRAVRARAQLPRDSRPRAPFAAGGIREGDCADGPLSGLAGGTGAGDRARARARRPPSPRGEPGRMPHATVSLGLNELAEAASREAIEILEALPPGPGACVRLCVQGIPADAQPGQRRGCPLGELALELVAEADDADVEARSNTIGTSYVMAGEIAMGTPYLQRSLDVAVEHGLHQRIASAYSMLSSGLGEMYELEESQRWAGEFIAFAARNDLDTAYIRSWLAATHVYLGRWDEGAALAQELLADEISADQPEHRAHRARSRSRAPRRSRRDGGAGRSARGVARERPPPAPGPCVCRARGSRLARRGTATAALEEARAVYELALEKRHLWFAGELAYWQWKCGDLHALRTGSPSRTREQIAGEWPARPPPGAARGCVYEAARALAESDEEGAARGPPDVRGARGGSRLTVDSPCSCASAV